MRLDKRGCNRDPRPGLPCEEEIKKTTEPWNHGAFAKPISQLAKNPGEKDDTET
jgi:hypothetical protein